ncbi:YifB family Mg chelatase-like AAA ATPase [Corynebacterium sp. TAE3-ERU12]|uniref:YifB family Mg chelatase-like AAA ATPase n=1 Tax=Corynebacterium sp. TAE3-ERU12 TaxID=2849491 RepID=UPI001C490306|nr:YifB family Mg chelatase-like AAA ATPase [Corynebacterium sp. TAE3-ERU12]MBV7295221.1 YifB family Mg chelatase-like AAA ATPase [Corynebacterium sp. TAE3-ERU12]
MAVGRASSVALQGIDGHLVTVEADVGRGLPGMHIGGLGDAAVSEARDRVRTAAVNSGVQWPRTKIVVSMSPASLRKYGSAYDLAIVCAVIAAGLADADIDHRLATTVLIGEVGLAGDIRAVSGVLPAVLGARDAGIARVVVPKANGVEAAMVEGMSVITAAHLTELWDWLRTGSGLSPAAAQPWATQRAPGPDMADVHGQPQARRALELAAAGGHHMLMVGAPGTGKSMLAQRLPGILPPLSRAEALESTAIHSVSSHHSAHAIRAGCRPFISPHHTASSAALLGGGCGIPHPGAVSLAHRGVLFLDEVSLMSGRVLDSLRTPLETGEVVFHRDRRTVCYPAQFQLIAAANQCRCGATEASLCTCTQADRRNHLKGLSGPLLDRIDLRVRLDPQHSVLSTQRAESSADIAARVEEARHRAHTRWAGLGHLPQTTNARVSGTTLRSYAPADDEGMAWLATQLAEKTVTQRGIDRTLRVAWTLADLAAKPQPELGEVADAIELHIDHEAVLA